MSMSRPIRSAAVLGAGTMGAQIAAHLANAGVPSLLLDLTAETARAGLERAAALKPDPFFTREAARLVTVGAFDRDLEQMAAADWIIEAVVERLDAKRSLLERVDAARRPGSIVSSNTSGIPIGVLAEGRSIDFRRHWLGTHFFNPPRYLRLVEVIPTPETAPDVVGAISAFADRRLGKGVVVAKDTPNFIANHVGLFGVMQMIRLLEAGEYTVEEIDAITGPPLGRPRSATFRTMDIAGIDVLAHVARNLVGHLKDEDSQRAFALPALAQKLVDRGAIGEKAGRGFYQRTPEGEILTLDPVSLSYRPRQEPRLPALDAARSIQDVGERIKALFLGADRVGAFLRRTLAPMLVYTARVAPAIAHSIDDVDRAMRWGYGWDIGPFEIWDAVGAQAVREAAGDAARPGVGPEHGRFRNGLVPPAAPDLQILKSAKDRQVVVRRNAGASLIDLGDGALALEFHSKMNALGDDAIQMVHAGIKEATANFSALVIGNDAPDFSAGANLMFVLLQAQDGNWQELDLMIRGFQAATQAIRYADVPVVVAPAGRALGGGCEIVLHADRVQAAAESYMGLVEVGVGLIPAGGGTKEMLARAVEGVRDPRAALLPLVQPVFETIGFGKVSSSAAHARDLGYLRPADGVTMNRERLMSDAKSVALERARLGYRPPSRRNAIPVGGEAVGAPLALGVHLAWRASRISDYDAHIGRSLAHILAGGALPHQTVVSEQYLLDLEREAFLQLCGERRTLERIQYTLKTGKPLRN